MTRVVVVGSGIAGLTAALHAHENGCHVTVVTKGALADTNTRWAQGGVAAVTGPADTLPSHAADTLTAGAGLNDPAAVDVLVGEGPERIAELVARGVAFDRTVDGDFARGLEAAHAVPRVLHAGGDATGAEIQTALGVAARSAGLVIRENAPLRDLVVRDGRVVGADLEFVQFHPTALAAGEPFLVSEAVRGEGATLVDDAGHRFCFDAHPDGELAPRDVVARANARAMAAQGGRPVRLDATALGAERLARRFPTIDAAVRARGLDWAREPIPVTPAAHYLMGGVVTDLDGRTTVPGLWAVGETARTGVHGANRLASNSLLEGAVFGARAGDAVGRGEEWPVRGTVPAGVLVSEPAVDAPPFTRAALQKLMWAEAGLVRDAAGLARAAAILAGWRVDTAPRSLEDANLLLVAAHVVAAARARTGSVGAHFRSDAPDVDDPAARSTESAGDPSTLGLAHAPAGAASTPVPEEVLAC